MINIGIVIETVKKEIRIKQKIRIKIKINKEGKNKNKDKNKNKNRNRNRNKNRKEREANLEEKIQEMIIKAGREVEIIANTIKVMIKVEGRVEIKNRRKFIKRNINRMEDRRVIGRAMIIDQRLNHLKNIKV